ncbi:hypothetical protein CYMTET_13964 [Cymbomonas tetramitiformis]|uniref:Uncharacterized protein n=1 Tax=Cymbomonas tetramitiformis TaxID=36881 RepID=A0AAE0GGZ2_9CHLO|nr:hypothetical protein CYMTET_13964 [Cymbomonas tetramitiformis]
MILIHMMEEDPTACGDDPHPKNWILDACCGAGSTAMAALRCGMNVVAFDNDEFMCASTTMRLNNFGKEHDGATETKTNAQVAQVQEAPGSSEARTSDSPPCAAGVWGGVRGILEVKKASMDTDKLYFYRS